MFVYRNVECAAGDCRTIRHRDRNSVFGKERTRTTSFADPTNTVASRGSTETTPVTKCVDSRGWADDHSILQLRSLRAMRSPSMADLTGSRIDQFP